MPISRRVVALGAVAMLVAACGGGGGGGGGAGGGGGVGGGPTSSVSGRIIFDRGRLGALTELEPNDSVSRPHPLGAIYGAQDLRVLGTATAATDPFDGFSATFPIRVQATVTLTIDDTAAGTLALSLFDPISMQFLGDATGAGAVKTLSFIAKGNVDLVVRALAGTSDYSLAVHTEFAPIPIAPVADPSGADELLGDVVPGDSFTYRGALSSATDVSDEVWITCPAAMNLTVTASYPPLQNFDLDLWDATTNLAAPTLIQSFATPTLATEGGTVAIAAGKLVAIRVHTATGTGTYTLSVRGDAVPAVQVAAARIAPARSIAPASIEAARLAFTTLGAPPYGRCEIEMVPREALVAFDDADAAVATAEIEARGGRILERLSDGVRRVELPVRSDLDPDETARVCVSRIRGLASAHVRFAEADSIHHVMKTPDDTYWSLQWDLQQMNLPKAWDVTTGSASVIVAVIDTGVRSHPDLASRLTSGYDFVSSASNSADGDGRDSDPTDPGDSGSSFHGTHVAGTIGAVTNNGTGVAGVTWATQIMPLRAMGYNGGSDSDISEAVRYAAGLSNASGTLPAKRANVINMSLGGGSYSATFQSAVSAAHAAGVVICAAAGNSNSTTPMYPAAYTDVLSVVALDYAKNRAPYSNYGSTVDISAPGGDMSADRNADGYSDGILSTRYTKSGTTYTPVYDMEQGTSMACPHVAGVAALVFAVNSSLTASQVDTILLTSAQDLGATGRDDTYGYGLVDAYAAVVAAAPAGGGGGGGTPPPPMPVLSLSPTSLNLDAIYDSGDLRVTNTGTGTLTVGAVDVTTTKGGAWLSFAGLSGPEAGVSNRYVHLSVNRADLAPGDYKGTVTVHSDGGTASADVYMTVLAAVPPLPDVDIHVRARRVDTGVIAAEIIVNPRSSLDWSFPTLPTGAYFFEASTDFDHDGVFDEDGDYAGGYPYATQPTIIDVVAGVPITGLDFSVTLKKVLGLSGG